jgi:bifunctional non-homologous end joining protein LigD
MADPMPEHVVPMLAKLSTLPRDDGGWGNEIKWDGVRAIAYVRDGAVRMESRNLNDVTARYPEVQGLAGALGAGQAVFDGEVVAFDEHGRSSFERLQGRMHLTRGVEAKARQVPVVYCIFDLLWIDGETTMRLPYTERRARLDGLGLDGPAWRVPGYSTGSGEQLLAAGAEQNLEGIICKRLESPYEPGRRGGTWLKVKNTRRQELVIGGWSSGEGRRAGHLGALHVGYYDDGALRYAGKVGTGFTGRELDRLEGLLAPRRRDDSPFAGQPQPERGTHYVDPDLVAEVEFTEWTSQKMLRHPSYKGLRDDKRPLDVVLERAGEPTAPRLRELIPQPGFTKDQVIDYYLRIAPTLLPHLRGRHVDGAAVDDLADLVRLVDGGTVELHAPLATVSDPRHPTALVFDAESSDDALHVRSLFDQTGLQTFPKADGNGGLQVYVPLNGTATHDEAAPFAQAVATTLERAYPDSGSIGWSHNAASGSVLAPYSLCDGARPTVAMPLAWDEVERGDTLLFDTEAAIARVEERGDLFAPVLTLRQELPSFD